MLRWPLQECVPNRTVDQIVDVSISQPRRNLEVFSLVSDAPIPPKKWTAPLAQSLGEMKIVNIKPLRWPRCDRAGCTYCIKSLIEKWQNCTLMHSVRSFHFSDISGLLREVSRVRGGLHPRLFGLCSCDRFNFGSRGLQAFSGLLASALRCFLEMSELLWK